MAVTTHVYPLAIEAINNGTIDLTSATGSAFKALLCTGSAATWGATQEAYQFVTDATGNYTEVTGGGYARVALTSLSQARSTNVVTWSCTSPITWGSSVTITAQSLFVYTTLVGSADASFPLICVVDFGSSQISSAGTFEYTCSSGLATWTES